MRVRFWRRSKDEPGSKVNVPGSFNPYSVHPVAWMRPMYTRAVYCISCGATFSEFRKPFEVAVYSGDDVEVFGPFDEACGSRRIRSEREAQA